MRISPSILLLPLLGCSEAQYNGQAPDDTGPMDPADTADTTGDGDSAPPETAQPDWFKLDGLLVIAAGTPDPTSTELRFEFQADPDADVAAQDTALDSVTVHCSRTPSVAAFTAETPTEPAVTMGWWAVTLSASQAETCPWILPDALHLGIGDLDPALQTAMDLSDIPDDAQLYGLYVQYGGETSPTWVFGVAGTESQYTGDTAPVTSPPLPNGTYVLTGLHLLPYGGR